MTNEPIILESYIPKPKASDLVIVSCTPEAVILSNGTIIDRIVSSVAVGGMLNGSVSGLSVQDRGTATSVKGADGIFRNHPSYHHWQVRHNVRTVEQMLKSKGGV